MQSCKVSKDDKDKLLKYRDMIKSKDKETRLLAISLTEEEFGNCCLDNNWNSLTLSQIIHMKNHDLNRWVIDWLFLAAIKYYSDDYLFFKENSLSN